jgi:hypothetical protein
VLAADPGATAHQTLEWFDAAIETTGAQDVSRLYALQDGRRLVVPMLRRSPLPRVALDSAYPGGLGAGGMLATGGLRAADVQLVLRDLLESPAVATRLKAHHHTSGRWEAGLVPGVLSTSHRIEVLDLDGGFARVRDERFHSSARRAIRKAESSGLVVDRDTTGALMPTIYDLYLDWTTRRAEESGLPTPLAIRVALRREPRTMYEAVARSLGEKCRIWVARLDGEPVAGLVSLVHGEHAVYWRGYSNKAVAGPLRANNLLQRMAIEDACEAGCRYYSMGESGGVAALERFKQTMGATPRVALECRVERLPLARLERIRGEAQARAAELVGAGVQAGRRRFGSQ